MTEKFGRGLRFVTTSSTSNDVQLRQFSISISHLEKNSCTRNESEGHPQLCCWFCTQSESNFRFVQTFAGVFDHFRRFSSEVLFLCSWVCAHRHRTTLCEQVRERSSKIHKLYLLAVWRLCCTCGNTQTRPRFSEARGVRSSFGQILQYYSALAYHSPTTRNTPRNISSMPAFIGSLELSHSVPPSTLFNHFLSRKRKKLFYFESCRRIYRHLGQLFRRKVGFSFWVRIAVSFWNLHWKQNSLWKKKSASSGILTVQLSQSLPSCSLKKQDCLGILVSSLRRENANLLCFVNPLNNESERLA